MTSNEMDRNDWRDVADDTNVGGVGLPGACLDVRDSLQQDWADGLVAAVAARGSAPPERALRRESKRALRRESKRARTDSWSRFRGLREHLDACPSCRAELDVLRDLDKQLSAGFYRLQASVDAPAPRIEATIDRLLADDSDIRLLRRLRRGLRTGLWITFYGFTLVAFSFLVVLAYRAVRELTS